MYKLLEPLFVKFLKSISVFCSIFLTYNGSNKLTLFGWRDIILYKELIATKGKLTLIIRLGDVKAGLAKRKEIFDAFLNFKNQNKEIIVYCDKNMISNNDYYLISMADKIFTNEHTGIDLKGINMEMVFLRGLLGTGALFCIFKALTILPIATATVIQYIYPTFTAISAYFILNERILSNKLILRFLIIFCAK